LKFIKKSRGGEGVMCKNAAVISSENAEKRDRRLVASERGEIKLSGEDAGAARGEDRNWLLHGVFRGKRSGSHPPPKPHTPTTPKKKKKKQKERGRKKFEQIDWLGKKPQHC